MDLVTIGLLAGFGAAAMALLVLQDYAAERRRVYRSLRNLESMELSAASIRERQLSAPVTARVLLPGLRRAGQAMRRWTPSGVLERLEHELVLAGSPAGWDAERVLAYKVVAMAGLGLATLSFGLVVGLPTWRIVLLAAVLTGAGYYVPEWLVRSQAAKRQAQLRRELPDTLDLLSITVEAGLGFDAALARVSRQVGGPLGQEFHRVIKEMQLGKDRSDALRALAERTTVDELRSFVLAMVQADIFGVSVANVLQVQASQMRLKRRQRAEEQAQKVPVKILFPLLFCIFPSIFVVLLGPAAIQIYDALLA